ncbi:hypothetical protein [Lelliottia sp. CFBP8978]|uniref:hypothetical protein n=1 Tax=Lelliottia sp. CFBP8978 TaxID=3096522 RepID=UPI002A69C445|nr:hypothetical protein [Lelliottia sp. CFBP8978]MDY1035636.1 hypothetical protein [Lelliottia sp. CFBP8978]
MDDIEQKMRSFGFTDKEMGFFIEYREKDPKNTFIYQLKGLRRVFYSLSLIYTLLVCFWFYICIHDDSNEIAVATLIMLFIAAVIYITTPFKLGLKAARFLNEE